MNTLLNRLKSKSLALGIARSHGYLATPSGDIAGSGSLLSAAGGLEKLHVPVFKNNIKNKVIPKLAPYPLHGVSSLLFASVVWKAPEIKT